MVQASELTSHARALDEAMRWVLARDGVDWSADTRLAAIDGWNSNKTVTTVLELQRRLGVRLPEEAVATAVTVGDLAHALDAATRGGVSRLPETRTSPFARFESLGEDCEFGLVQQGAGVMQPHLLRFAAFLGDAEERLARLVAAVEQDFAGLADPACIEVRLPDAEWNGATKEYRIVNTRYGWTTHTGLLADRIDRAQAEARLRHFPETLDFLLRHFLRELRHGSRVWIWKSTPASSPDQVEALLRALQRHGPNRLLWIRRAEAAHPPATVVTPRPGLHCGYIDKSDAPWSGAWSEASAWHDLIGAAVAALPAEARPGPAPDAADRFALRRARELLAGIAAAEIGMPGLSLAPGMMPADVPGWDSLRHVGIVLAVEQRLGRPLTEAEMDRTMTLDGFAEVIAAAP